jgi:hypothetical protein
MAINVENFQKLRDTLLAEQAKGKEARLGFNMVNLVATVGEDIVEAVSYVEDHLNTCGTVACLCGWCFVIQHPEAISEDGTIKIPRFDLLGDFSVVLPDNVNYTTGRAVNEAAEWLGLTQSQANDLFMLHEGKEYISKITLESALAHLNRIIKLGEFVRWRD